MDFLKQNHTSKEPILISDIDYKWSENILFYNLDSLLYLPELMSRSLRESSLSIKMKSRYNYLMHFIFYHFC